MNRKDHKKRDEYLEELRKVKARREEYEREREEREQKRMDDQRAREAELFGDWQEKEEEFHRIQSKRRCATETPFSTCPFQRCSAKLLRCLP